MKTIRDLVIIGAGPAGISAAATAAAYGLDVLVLDEQPSIGGQIYRNIERASNRVRAILGPDYRQGLNLANHFRQSRAEIKCASIVWRIDADGRLCFSHDGHSQEIQARRLLIATGAMERPVPFPGWTLPGVMGAGAVDANFKSAQTVPRGPVALAGNGPLLLLTAGHLNTLGVPVAAILDTTPSGNMLSSLPYMPRALKRPDYLLKGLAMMLDVNRAKIKYIRHVKTYAAHGDSCLDHVSYSTGNGVKTIAAAALLVHEGVIPRCDLTRQIGLAHYWNAVQRYWYPKATSSGKTDMPAIYVAGDGAFVHGGVAAEIKGALAAIDMAAALHALDPNTAKRNRQQLNQRLRAELAPRPFVDAWYRPRPDLYTMPPDTLVCRCEAVTAGDIRQAMDEGCRDPNEIKALTRCGMGPCQGRMCGMALNEIMSEALGVAASDFRPLNIRPPIRNVSLAELAELTLLDEEQP
jgi:thioredoxin reductase/bacterioferritin-associated ferredoxin